MRTIMQKLWIRALVMVLCCLCAASAVVSLSLFNFGLEDGWYAAKVDGEWYATTEDFSFKDSSLCREYIDECLRVVAENLNWLGNPTSTTLGGYGGSSFSYTISGSNMEGILADTTTSRSHFVSYLNMADYGWYASDGSYYCIQGYINLPVEPYDGCYREYYVFNHIFAFRDSYLSVGIISLVIAAASLVFCLTAAVLDGKRGVVTPLGNIAFDGGAVGLFLAGSVCYRLARQLWSRFNLRRIMYQIGLPPQKISLILLIFGLALASCILANQLSARIWHKKLLVPQLLKKIPPTIFIAALMLLHMALLVVCWTDGVFILLLGMFDLALIPCIIRWLMEENRIRQASDALAAGDLSYKVNAKRLHLVWRRLGENLNSIGDGMALAVEEQMRSERMKTELITNVSHDLKTPLTSIINYIELLKRADLPEDVRREYLDIIARQSAKLKKLTEDVVDASKAASGAVKVNAEVFDVRELLEQTVGEYSERLTAAGVEPVVHMPEREVNVLADGRLLGRVLDNLTGNILKYAQPGTRAYFDLLLSDNVAVIQLKNTSREPLDIPAEELMERFVRGDSSRSTEGSGLGLSIARSLTELMGGQMELILDGDLFKAEIVFPRVLEAMPVLEESISDPQN